MSVRTRLSRLEAKMHSKPAGSGMEHIKTALAKCELSDRPDLRLVEPQDTDSQTYNRIAWTVAVANGMAPAQADRVYPHTIESALLFIPKGETTLIEMDNKVYQRERQATLAAIAAARTRHGLSRAEDDIPAG